MNTKRDPAPLAESWAHFLCKHNLVGRPPIVATLERVEADVALPDGRVRPVAYFAESAVKPLPLSFPAVIALSQIAGSHETADWPGTCVEIYLDLDVEFRGKRVGGIRVRAPETSDVADADRPISPTGAEDRSRV